MSGHYEYNDLVGDDVWVEDPPAAKTAPVVAAGLPALAAVQPAPVAPVAAAAATPDFANMPGLGFGGFGGVPISGALTGQASPTGYVNPYSQDQISKYTDMFFDGKDHSNDAGYTAFLNDKDYQNAVASGVAGMQFDLGITAKDTLAPVDYKNPGASGPLNWLDMDVAKSNNDTNYWQTNAAPVINAPADVIAKAKSANGKPIDLTEGGQGYVWRDGALHQTNFVNNTGMPTSAVLPMVLSMMAPGIGTAIGSALGAGATFAPIIGGAILGGGSAALTGGDILKSAFLGGLGGASNVGIGDTGATVGQVTSAVNLVKNLKNGNWLGAITGAANLSGAGNTQIGETGLTINDLSKDLNLAKAVISGNPQALMGALTSVASSATNSAADASKAIDPYFQTGAGTGAATPDYPTNDAGTQQLIDALTNTPAATGPSVQVASNDNASALAALEDAKTAAKIDSGQIIDLGEVSNKPPDAELPPGLIFPGDQSTPTEAQQQQAISNFHDALAETQQPETPITNPDALIGKLQDAGLTDDFIGKNTPILGIIDPTDQIGNPPPISAEERALLAPQAPEPTVEQIIASEPPAAVNPVALPPDDFIGDPTDQIGNPPPISAEERALLAPQAPTTSPDPVQDLLDQATPSDQPAIDQQTKDLLSLLSGGTDTGVTPAETPVFKAEPDAAGTDAEFYKMIGIDPNTIDPFKNVEGELDPSDLAINRAYKIDQANQQGNEWDNASIGDDLFTTEPPTEEPPIDQVEITGKRPTDDSEPGWEGWTPPPTPIDYSGISDILSGGQSKTPPEEAPAVSVPRIPTTPAPKTPAVVPAKTVAPVANKPAAALASAIAQGYMPSVGDVAHIKSLESLFGPLLGMLPAEPAHEKKDDSLSALEGMDQEYASGGHVDDFSVEALLHILRS